MNSQEVRKKFLSFFEKRGHSIIPSASLIPENDPSVLFTTAGMQPLVPYLLGEKHPHGNKLANIQKVLRTVDIDEVGDKTHLTFFEMMGNWSLGDYFKKEAITWSYELLTDEKEGFGLDPKRLYVTCFEGDEDAPKDTESAEIWKSLGIPEHRIYFNNKEDNWWSPGDNGPCGSDTEMFYDITEDGLGDLTPEQFKEADDRQQVVEIWNDVFMEYEKKDGKIIGKLQNKNVDTGSGFERIVTVLQNKQTVFDTDIFTPILEKIKSISENSNDHSDQSEKIIADHLRAATFLISDGVIPSNTDQGYILRRLIRRAYKHAKNLGIKHGMLQDVISIIIAISREAYPALEEKEQNIYEIYTQEEDKFQKTLESGIKQLEKIISKNNNISGEDAFTLFSTYGFPIELTLELAKEKGISIDLDSFNKSFEEHKNSSRTASAGKFKGGLAGDGEMEVKYHTATHLLNAALREVLGDHVYQKGSNITSERLRFDFSHPEKLTDEEKEKVTNWINEKIENGFDVIKEEMSLEEAKELGAIGVFEDKYGNKVFVYSILDKESNKAISRELCGGPHVDNIKDLGVFRIKKEEASSAGVRRIKAILE